VKKVRVPHIPRPRATYATEFVAQGPWIQPALELDPYTKLSLMEYESLDNKTAAAFIVELQDHLESAWCSYATERKKGMEQAAELTALGSKQARTTAALKQASHRLVTLGQAPEEPSTRVDDFWC